MNEETYMLGHGAIESQKTAFDVHIDSVMATLPPDGFSADYSSVIHDNQRKVGICTMASVADVIRKIYGVEVSEQYGYVGGKKKYDKNMYEGSSIKTMLEFARTEGLPRKSLVPTDNTAQNYADYVNVNFSDAAKADAQNYKIPGYAYVEPTKASIIKAGSVSPFGVLIMIRVGDNFYTDKNHRSTWDGKILSPLRDPKPIDGAHAIKIVRLTVDGDGTLRNTWGDKDNPIYPGPGGVWGNNGDIEFDWDTQAPYIVEAWTILPAPAMQLFKHKFSTPIKYGQMGSSEVVALQRVLKKYQDDSQLVTGNYMDMTAKNVLAFQLRMGVAPADQLEALQGKNVGPATREALNSLMGL